MGGTLTSGFTTGAEAAPNVQGGAVKLTIPEGNGEKPIEADYNARQLQLQQAIKTQAETESIKQSDKPLETGSVIPTGPDVKEHPIISALRTAGLVTDPVGMATGALGAEGLKAAAVKAFPDTPWIHTAAEMVGGILGGGTTNKTSAILNASGEPIELGAKDAITELTPEQEVKSPLSPESVTEQTRSPQAQSESYYKAFEAKLANPSDEEFQQMKPGTILNAEQKAELNLHANERVDNITKLAQNWVSAKTPEEREAAEKILGEQLPAFENLAKVNLGNAAETGRALAIHNTNYENVQSATDLLASMTPQNKEDTMTALASLGEDPEKLEKTSSFLKDLLSGAPVYKALINARLMNPRITFAKAITDFITIPYNVFHQSLSTAIFHPDDLPTAGKMLLAGLGGMKEGFLDGVKFAKLTFKTGEHEFEKSIGLPTAHAYGQESLEDLQNGEMNLANDTLHDRFFHWMASAYGVGVRGVLSADQFAKCMSDRAETRTQALYRGLQDAEKEGKHWNEALQIAERNASAYVRTMPKWLRRLSTGNMQRDTYTDSDAYTDAAANIVKKIKPLRILLPFTHTPVNMFESGLMNSPLAPITAKFIEDMTGKSGLGELTRNTTLTRWATGTALAAMIFHETIKGNVTGDHPADNDPNHARCWHIGNDFISYRYLGGFATQIALSANFAEHWGGMNKDDQSRFGRSIIQTFGDTAENAPLMDEMAHAFEAMRTAQEQGGTGAAGKFGGDLLSQFIPHPVGQLAQELSPSQKKANDMWQEIEKSIPGLSENVPSVKDMFGHTQYIAPGATRDDTPPHWYYSLLDSMNPLTIYHSKEPDIVDKEIVRTGYVPKRLLTQLNPSDKVDTMQLDVHQYDHYSQMAGHGIKLLAPDGSGDMLDKHDYMERIIKMTGPYGYENIPNLFTNKAVALQHQKTVLERINDAFDNAAKQHMVAVNSKYPELHQRDQVRIKANTSQLGEP